MSHHPTLTTQLAGAAARPGRTLAGAAARPGRTRAGAAAQPGRRPGLAARGATLARMLFVPGAAEQIVGELDGGAARELRAVRRSRARAVAADCAPFRS